MGENNYRDQIFSIVFKIQKVFEEKTNISKYDQEKLDEANNLLLILKNYETDINALNDIIKSPMVDESKKEVLIDAITAIKLRGSNKFLISLDDDEIRLNIQNIIVDISNSVKNIIEKIESIAKEEYNNILSVLKYLEKCFEKSESIDINVPCIESFLLPSGKVFSNRQCQSYYPEMIKLINSYNSDIYEKMLSKIGTKKREIVPQIDIEELRQVFLDNGYNIDDFDQILIKRILNNGDINIIKYVFGFLKNTEYFKTPIKITKNNEEAMLTLLYRSNEQVIEKMIEVHNEYGIEMKDMLTKSITSFYAKSRARGGNSIPTSEDGVPFFNSTHSDFIKNIEFLKNEGYNIKRCYDKNSSAFSLNNEKVIKNANDIVKVFNLIEGKKYNSIHDIYSDSIAWMRGDDVIKLILLYSELGELEYIKNNPSRLNMEFSKIVPYRIKVAQELDFPYNYGKTSFRRVITAHSTDIDDEKTKYTDDSVQMKILNSDPSADSNHLYNNIFDKATEEMLSQEIEEFLIGDTSFVENLDFIKNIPQDNEYYIINGVKINKIKFNNAFAALYKYIDTKGLEDIMLFCMNYNSLLTDEEFEILKDGVHSIVGRKK